MSGVTVNMRCPVCAGAGEFKHPSFEKTLGCYWCVGEPSKLWDPFCRDPDATLEAHNRCTFRAPTEAAIWWASDVQGWHWTVGAEVSAGMEPLRADAVRKAKRLLAFVVMRGLVAMLDGVGE